MRVFSSRKMETTERREQLETVQTEIISKYSINPFFNSLSQENWKKRRGKLRIIITGIFFSFCKAHHHFSHRVNRRLD